MRKRVKGGLAAAIACLAVTGIAVSSQAASAAPGAVSPGAAAAAGLAGASGSREFMAEAFQRVPSEGAFADVTVANPFLARQDLLTDAVIRVSTADFSQMVVAGWIVDRAIFGDAKTHLLGFTVVNAVSQVVGAGFKQIPGACRLGEPLKTGGRESLSVKHAAHAWWIAFAGHTCGSFPDSVWHGKFTSARDTQWSGEVFAATSRPCTDMGNGRFASSPAAARFSGMGLYGLTGARKAPHFSTSSTDSRLYSRRTISRTEFRFGGGGAC